jgi:hypothetical protein
MSDQSRSSDEIPPSAIGAVALGIAPVPFLGIYATLFILRGTILPVSPPDITSTQTGEALWGVVALAYMLAIVIGAYLFLTQRDRWLLLVGQLICLVICVDFVLNPSSGEPGVPVLLGLTAALAIACGLVGPSWAWVSGAVPTSVKSPSRQRRHRLRRTLAPAAEASEVESPHDLLGPNAFG